MSDSFMPGDLIYGCNNVMLYDSISKNNSISPFTCRSIIARLNSHEYAIVASKIPGARGMDFVHLLAFVKLPGRFAAVKS